MAIKDEIEFGDFFIIDNDDQHVYHCVGTGFVGDGMSGPRQATVLYYDSDTPMFTAMTDCSVWEDSVGDVLDDIAEGCELYCAKWGCSVDAWKDHAKERLERLADM